MAVGFAGPALVLACWLYQAHRGEGWPGPWAGQQGGGLSPQEPREEPVGPALRVTSRGSGLGAAGPRGPGGMWAVLGGVGQPDSLERVEGGDGSQRVAQVPEWAGESRPRGRRKAEGWGRGRDGRSPRARLPETSAHLTDGDSEAQGVPGPCLGWTAQLDRGAARASHGSERWSSPGPCPFSGVAWFPYYSLPGLSRAWGLMRQGEARPSLALPQQGHPWCR